jgi:hypothetical protein
MGEVYSAFAPDLPRSVATGHNRDEALARLLQGLRHAYGVTPPHEHSPSAYSVEITWQDVINADTALQM